eukprot:TRINITY_DN78_c0_g2_i1.p1 TRINITY_DN78_c0_g2~~TRINITY_DN78_c0_g2_i1.p1  ORF type:complete len:386 (+),score=87.93 TRINITY_DN78_c0_g2_i1:45-1202(+)
MTSINEYIAGGGSVGNLETVEQFFIQLDKIPKLKTRMSCMTYKLNFPEKMAELRPALLKIDKAIRDMKRKGKNFLKVIEIILAIGNFLNGNTTRGNCMGFSLNSLLKINDTRTTDNKATLMHYIVQFIEDKHPDLLKWTKELSSVRHATKVSFPAVQSEMAALKKSTEATEKKVQAVMKEEKRKPDNFDKMMPSIVEKCKKEYEELEKLFNKVSQDYEKLAEKFGEEPKTTPPEALFGMVSDFMNLFKKARKEVKIQKAKAEKERKRKLQQEKKQRELARKKRQRQEEQAKGDRDKEREARRERRRKMKQKDNDDDTQDTNNGDGDGDNDNEEGEVDTKDLTDAITQLRSGKAFKKRRLRRQDTLRQNREQKGSGSTKNVNDVFK